MTASSVEVHVFQEGAISHLLSVHFAMSVRTDVVEHVNITSIRNLNRSNSTACAVQVEANLQEHLSDNLHLRKQKFLLKYPVFKVISHLCASAHSF